ncbi:MAG: hypothetical protein LIO44_06150, partial [Eubacterium sp.]|nr:hypothetical protein [Eubacterium sp.]
AFNTFKKFDILHIAMNIMYNARMIGVFNYGIKINADLGVGNLLYTMAIAKRENMPYYFPMGILKGDTRNITNNTSPVIAVLSRNFLKENMFCKVTYISKNININNLHFPQELVSLITNEALLQIKPNINI